MKKLIIGIGIVLVLILIGGIVISSGILKGDVVKEKVNEDLAKYRSENIPEACRLPDGQNIESWKEHLSHHKETQSCLEYYKDVN